MKDLHELERAILSARDTGNVTRMRELQDVYRSSATVTRITREPVYVTERLAGAASVVGAAVAAPARVFPPSRPLPLAVRLMPFAREPVEEALELRGREIGFWLQGRREDVEVVVYLSYPRDSWGAADGYGYVTFPLKQMRRLEERAAGAGHEIVGTVHSHPGHQVLRPSGNDERSWREMTRDVGHDTVHLLVGPGDGEPGDLSYQVPRFKCWLCSVSDSSIRPAPLILQKD